ncbi:hypothetical protein [Uliginosibacterium gangwonense]|uniref:hypothetical protein n=1 Tax=Uliginosibacterium gangwonense TaxID=392736 RepID=UPI000378C13D|nr:hypothetical protein [Uliginosibacterium gangwonense]
MYIHESYDIRNFCHKHLNYFIIYEQMPISARDAQISPRHKQQSPTRHTQHHPAERGQQLFGTLAPCFTEMEAELAQWQAQAEQAQGETKRPKPLAKDKVISQCEYDEVVQTKNSPWQILNQHVLHFEMQSRISFIL